MSKAEALRRHVGGNVAESMGIREETNGTTPRSQPDVIPISRQHEGRRPDRNAGYMDIDNIVPDPDQPRNDFDDAYIERLAKSMQKVGQLSPITVRWDTAGNKHVIVAGECRWRAAKLAGLESVRVLFKEDMTEDQVFTEQLIENCVRQDLNNLDRARAFSKLREKHSWTLEQLADALFVTKSMVSKTLSLLELPEEGQRMVAAKEVSASTAYHAARKGSTDDEKVKLLKQARDQGLTRDQAAEAAGKTSRIDNTRRPGRPSTRREFRTGAGVKVVFTFSKKRVTNEDLLAAIDDVKNQIAAA